VIGVRVDYPLNMYIAGSFSGTCEFGTFSTSLQQTAVGSTDIYVANYHVAGSSATINWAGGYGGTGSEAVQGFGRDSSDNLYVAGTFAGSSNLGGGAVTSVGGSNDGFLASYNSSGAYRWSKVYGGPGLDLANSVVSTSTGDVVVTGRFTGSVNFGGGSITSYGGTDAFLARYTGAGAHVWSEKLGGTLEDYGTSVAIDAADNLTLAGYFDGTTNVGGGPLVSAGTEDVFLARYNAGGVNLWSQRFGGAGADWSNAVTVDPFGSVILTGTFQGTSGFGGSLFTSNGGSRDIFIAHYGGWPAEPVVRSVVDAGNDQGRNVTLDISPSGWDAASSATPVLSYEVYRRDKPTPSAAAANDGAWRAPGTKRTPGWEYVGAVPAQLKGEYFLGAPTVGDSTIALGQYYSTFFVRATTATPSVFFDSPVDSGYSVDNIAPPAPASFAYSVGNLSWLASTADDFDYFSVYGSATSTFNASAVLIGHTIGTGYNVNANNYPHYFVTATDFSGNEGKPAHVNKSTGVNDSPRYALAVNAYPNPFNPLTTIRYDVPSAGNVVVSVYDASGALLTTLVNGARAPGSYSVRWDGRNAAGNPASSGVYFVKLSVNGQTTTRKVALVK
jgi:hypothetical protein